MYLATRFTKKLHNRNPYFLLFFLVIINPWSWIILKSDLLLASGICAIMLLLTKLFFSVTTNRICINLLIIFLIFTSIYLVIKYPYSSIFKLDPTEQKIFYSRHQYLSNELGLLYENKIGTFIYTHVWDSWGKYWQNFFYSIDFNQYFFLSHPLERKNIDEFDKFFPPLLPFFVIGLINFIFKINKIFILYLAIVSFLSGFIHPNSAGGSVLFFPIVCIIIVNGIMLTFRLITKVKIN